MMLSIGIDPGIRITGFCALEIEEGSRNPDVLFTKAIKDAWRPSTELDHRRKRANKPDLRRIKAMSDNVWETTTDIIEKHGHNHEIIRVCIEHPFVGAKVTQHILKTHAVFSHLAYLTMERTDEKVMLLSIHPMQLKRFVGAVRKKLIIREVYRLWGFDHDDDNVVDAYALARYAIQWIGNREQAIRNNMD